MRAALQFLTAGIVLFAGVDGLLGSDRGTEIILAVKKRPTYFVSYVTEKVWLQRMQGSGVTVEPLAFFDGDQTLVLQHVGNPVTKDTLPGDWEVQLLHILEVFLERNCRHNDLKPEEIMVDGTGRLRIVDLGFASEAFGGAPLTRRGCPKGRRSCCPVCGCCMDVRGVRRRGFVRPTPPHGQGCGLEAFFSGPGCYGHGFLRAHQRASGARSGKRATTPVVATAVPSQRAAVERRCARSEKSSRACL